MANEHFHEQVWEYVYGLLDKTETENLRAHAAACPSCQAALTEAEGQQQLLARAARVVAVVPAFTAPGQQLEPETAPPPPAMVVSPVVAPANPSRRSIVRRYWPAWAAAAALLGIAVGLNEVHRGDVARQEVEVAQLKKNLDALDGRFATLKGNVAKEKQVRARTLQEQIPPQMQVLGAVQVRPEAPVPVQVTTRGVDGQLQPSTVTTTVKENGKLLYENTERIDGAGTIQVPALKLPAQKTGPLKVTVEARNNSGKATTMEETLRVTEPTNASHLALNKSIYYVGEVLFFRTLTLDRYNLKPPEQALPLRFTLLDAQGRAVKELQGQTGPGGVSGGELALTQDLMAGNYSFQVAAAAHNQGLVVPQTRNLEILRGETPQIEFDRYQYKPGDNIGFNFRAGGQMGNNPYANKNVTIDLKADGQHVPQSQLQAGQTMDAPIANQAGGSVQTRLDREGNLNNFRLTLPPQIKNGAQLVIGLQDGKKDNKLVQSIPVLASETNIEFFPEGGDLVAGVANRVYYRVLNGQGVPVDHGGRVLLLASKKVLIDSEHQRGLGTFTFTPDSRESYTVRITGSETATEIHKPFDKLGIKAQGLVLHAPNAVNREGTPVAVVVRNQGPARRLLLQTSCRGQIVEQQYVDAPAGSRTVNLAPSPGANGILRVTALEVSGNQLVPVAERLLFRVPEKRLDVSCQISNGAGPFPLGSRVNMKIKATDEKKNPGPTWMLAAVVDEKFQADKHERSLPIHFYMAGEFSGDALDNTDLVLTETPGSWQALDLFLGTQGWRRFVRGETPPLLALNDKAAVESKAATPPAVAFFSHENTTSQKVQDQYQAALQKEVSELIERANRERADLLEQREVSLQVFGQAVRDLADLQLRPRTVARLAAGVLWLVLLVAAGVFLSVGLFRLVRRQDERPTGCFAGAFACLFACLMIYVLAARMPQEDTAHSADVSATSAPNWPEFVADPVTRPSDPTKDGVVPPSPPQGYFLAQTAPAPADKQRPATQPHVYSERAALDLAKRGDNPRALNPNNFAAPRPGNGDARRLMQENLQTNEELRQRFLQAEAKAKEQQAGSSPQKKAKALPQSASPAKGMGGLGATGDRVLASETYLRQYAHRVPAHGGRLDLQDTLLWHPTLFSADGTTDVSFDLSQNLSTYRILVYANSPSGRLGFYEGRLETRPTEAPPK